MSSNVVLQPNPPHLTNPICSMPEMPFCNTPKKPNLHHCLKSQLPKENIFLTELCGLLWVFFVLVRVSQREQESKILPISLSSFFITLLNLILPIIRSFFLLNKTLLASFSPLFPPPHRSFSFPFLSSCP